MILQSKSKIVISYSYKTKYIYTLKSYVITNEHNVFQ